MEDINSIFAGKSSTITYEKNVKASTIIGKRHYGVFMYSSQKALSALNFFCLCVIRITPKRKKILHPPLKLGKARKK